MPAGRRWREKTTTTKPKRKGRKQLLCRLGKETDSLQPPTEVKRKRGKSGHERPNLQELGQERDGVGVD